MLAVVQLRLVDRVLVEEAALLREIEAQGVNVVVLRRAPPHAPAFGKETLRALGSVFRKRELVGAAFWVAWRPEPVALPEPR